MKNRYPIGEFIRPDIISNKEIEKAIGIIESLPSQIIKTTSNLSKETLLKNYRPDSWNIAQIIHHLADSHINSFIRFKLALSEDNPTIMPFSEEDWGNMDDIKVENIQDSILILMGVHSRWSMLLKSMSEQDFEKSFYHPNLKRNIKLSESTLMYAWHCQHHLEHINIAINKII